MQKANGKLNFFLVFLVALTLVAGPSTVFAESTGASTTPDHLVLNFTQDPATGITITWRTDTTVTSQSVQYSLLAGNGREALKNGGGKTVNATAKTLVTDLGTETIWTATLTGLVPGKRYTYRVGSNTSWSDDSSFTTAEPETKNFKFLLFGDAQSGEDVQLTTQFTNGYTPWGTTVKNAYAANPDASFIVNLGDLVECGGYASHWNGWFSNAKGVIDHIAEMPVQGNHETYSSVTGPTAWATRKPVEFTTQFAVPQNGPAGLIGQVYSYDYGNVHIAVLDSQWAEETTASDYTSRGFANSQAFLDAQVNWLKNDLASTSKTWKIVMFHKTPYYNKQSRTNEVIKANFEPVLNQYGVDIVFNGHDHGISHTYPMSYKPNDFPSYATTTSPVTPVNIGADFLEDHPAADRADKDGTVYYVTGRSGNKAYVDLSKKVWDEFLFDCTVQPAYIVAQVNGKNLTLTARKQDGSVIDTYSLSKTGNGHPHTVPAMMGNHGNPAITLYGNPSTDTAGNQLYASKDSAGNWWVPLAFVQTNFTQNSAASISPAALANSAVYTLNSSVPAIGNTYTAAKQNNPNYTFNSSTGIITFTMGSTAYQFTVGSTAYTKGTTGASLASPITIFKNQPCIAMNDVYAVWGFEYSIMTDAAKNAKYFALTKNTGNAN